jgi:hypothetical protein
MIKFKVDNSGLERLFKGMPKRVLVAVGSEIRTAARTFAAVAAKNTLPYGAYENPPDEMMGRVKIDVERTQRPIDKLGSIWQDLERLDKGLAAGFWAAIKSKRAGESPEFTKWVLDKYLDEIQAKMSITHGAVRPKIHKQARTTPKRAVPKNHKPTHIIIGKSNLDNYVAKKQKTIGAAKAGWAAAAKSIGGSVSEREGFRKWFNTGRHKKSTGYHNMIRTETETFIELTNTVPWADVAFPPSQKKRVAVEFYPAFKRAIEKRKAALVAAAAKRRK